MEKLNVLVLGSDMNILETGSESANRMKEYGKISGRMDIALFNGKLFGRSDDVYAVSDNVFVHPKSLFGLLSLLSLSRLSFVLDHKIDIVSSQDPFVLGYIARMISNFLKVPLHIQVHTDPFNSYYRYESFYNLFKVMVAKRIIKKADGIRVVSERIKNSIIQKVSTKVAPVVLPLWVDVDAIKKSEVKESLRTKYPQFEKIILMASRITREKNFELALRAMKSIAKKYPKIGLVIVGAGPLIRRYKRMFIKFGLENNVAFELWSNDLPSYYKTADLFLLTSNYEGYGRTVVEAMAAGLPVLMTDVGCAGEIVKDGINGMIFPVNKKKKLLEKIDQFFSDATFREKIKKGVKETDLKVPTKEKYLELYEKSWRDCLK